MGGVLGGDGDVLTFAPGIRQWMGNGFRSKAEIKEAEQQTFEDYNESRRARGMKMLDPPKEEAEEQDSKKA